MTSCTLAADGPSVVAEEAAGPLEQRHLQYANYCAVADGSKVSRTHWHIALANRRSLLAVNIAMFSLMMPILALSPNFAVFVGARSLLTIATNGEWSLGSIVVAETWPAHLRGRVISINRATWCFGASSAGAITGLVAGTWSWRTAVMVPGVIALLAISVRATCPGSPY